MSHVLTCLFAAANARANLLQYRVDPILLFALFVHLSFVMKALHLSYCTILNTRRTAHFKHTNRFRYFGEIFLA